MARHVPGLILDRDEWDAIRREGGSPRAAERGFFVHDTWIYRRSTGSLFRNGLPVSEAQCYSGAPGHINDARSEAFVGKGPIPIGVYWCLAPRRHPTLGPIAIPLDPAGSNEMFGRSGFYVHGDNVKQDRSASQGCVICNATTRAKFMKGDLFVVLP